MEVRTTPTKQWLKSLKLQHLSGAFERHGFETLGNVSAMDVEDLDVIFGPPHQLKLGERRLLQQQIELMKKELCFSSACPRESSNSSSSGTSSSCPATATNTTGSECSSTRKCPIASATRTAEPEVPSKATTRKKLTYQHVPEPPVRKTSPLESWIEQQKDDIKAQQDKIEGLEESSKGFTEERTSHRRSVPGMPCCGKCHLKEGHNRLNCPYPKACTSAKFCCNIDKHPEDKQLLKEMKKELADERKTLQEMQEEIKNRQKSLATIEKRYAARIKDTLIESDPERYTRAVNGRVIEDWRLLNKDSKILERQLKGKMPSPEQTREVISNFEKTAPPKVIGKTSVHRPFKTLWESRGVSWPSNSTVSATRTADTEGEEVDRDLSSPIHSPQRKKVAIEIDNDYQLALAMQKSLTTLPTAFDLEEFERRTASREELAAAGNDNQRNNRGGNKCSDANFSERNCPVPEKPLTMATLNLDTLATVALKQMDESK